MDEEFMDEEFMREALSEAQKSYNLYEVPIGAIVVKNGEIIGRGHNLKETRPDATLHAEISAIKEACLKLGGWRLQGCTMYVTLEPCPMCAGAILNARIDRLVIGVSDHKTGACGSVINIFDMKNVNHNVEIQFGMMEEECREILKKFFKNLRQMRINVMKNKGGVHMLLELMQKRRSIRKYTDEKIEPEKLEMLKQAALLSPTSKNKQGWEFVFIENKQTLLKLAQCKSKGSAMIEDSALAVVVAIDCSKNDVWVEDGSIAATFIHLMAEKIGLGSCWVQIRNRFSDEANGILASDVVKDILGMPNNLEVVCIMSIGYKAEASRPHALSDLKYDKIHIEKY